ncbi:MAG TPA: ribosome maturation factor RimP [Saprospiraceae bacterium]|nr:ribosome maturation factor RimP [Saprospiraceae bacterium]
MYTEEIQNLLAQKFQEEGFQDCFLVSIGQHKKTIQVFVDADSGITFEKCQKISRFLEAVFDETKWFGEDYVLEVSSPGISRPLVFPRQYVKNTGRELQLQLTDGSELKGTILGADEKEVRLSRIETRKEGKKKISEVIETEIPYPSIKEAKIVIKI